MNSTLPTLKQKAATMECPNCKHATNNTALLQCSHCGEAFERGPLEEYQHLHYLAGWLGDRAEISYSQKKDLLAIVEKKQAALLNTLLPVVEKPKPVETKPAPIPAVTPIADVKPAPVVVKPEIKPVTPPVQVTKPAPAVLKAEVKQVAPPAPLAIPASKPKPVVAPKPAAPPKPKKPPVDWGKIIAEAATSGALLRALLYLGAFMIVVSAAVLVIRFWNQFNPILQLVFIASIPLTFYAGGWLVRVRVKLVQAGTVLTGIGAVLVAVDFAAIYQLAALGRINGPTYWLVVTIFCTALYAFTARRIQGEFFDYLTLLAAGSVLFTFTRLLKLPVDWSVASVTASGALMTLAASRFSKAKAESKAFLRAARYLSQILIPVSVMYVILLPIKPPTGHMLAFLFAAIGYSVLAINFPAVIFAYTALAASIGTILYGLRVTELSSEWYATVAGVLALVYILIGQRVQRIKSESTIIKNYVTALNVTGLVLIVITALGGFLLSFDKVWAGVIAMTIATLDLAICAYIFNNSLFTLFASGLFVLPFSIAVGRWFSDTKISNPFSWLVVAISGLAFAYIVFGAALKKAQAHARWLYVMGHALIGITLLVMPFDYLANYIQWHFTPALISLGIGIGTYLLSFLLQHSGSHLTLTDISKWLPFNLGKSIFLWPIGFLIPIWLTVAWTGYALPNLWLGATLTGLGLSYIALGQWLYKFAKEYRLPFHTFVYVLCTIGILIAIPSNIKTTNADWYSLLSALIITVTSTVVLAVLYNRIAETIIASLLFIWVFQLSLQLFKTPLYTQTIAYVILASLVYTPIAVYLKKNEKSRAKFHYAPVFIVGYALTAYAVIVSVVLRDTNTFIPWIGVAVPLIATALLTFSASYFKAAKFSTLWAWAGTLTFTIAFGQSLTLFKVPAAYDALAWVGIAAFYMLFERTLFFTSQNENRAVHKFWSGMFHQPWIIFTFALTALGLSLSLPDTLNAFTGTHLKNFLPIILAQVSVVALAIASARLYQNRWLLFIEPFIAFLPATLFFIGYGKQIFQHSFTTPQYALVWTTLGAIHLIAGTLIDHAKVRYSHGLYLGGYTFLSWAVFWSLLDRATLTWTLGFWILASTASALLVHFNRHQTWDEFIHVLFGKSANILRTPTRNLFQWLAAWTFPIWCTILLFELNAKEFAWLGLVVPPLAYFGLALWLRRFDSRYATPLHSAAQFFTAIGLLISAPTTFNYLINLPINKQTLLAFIILQAIAVIFYTVSAWTFKSRGFTHVAAWLSILPITLAWKFVDPAFAPIRFAIPWILWSTLLLSFGFALDKNKVRYSHGPYLAGYALMSWAVSWSLLQRPTLVWALGAWILAAIISALLVHFNRHQTWDDFVQSLFGNSINVAQNTTRNLFQWLAAWTFPIWCVLLLFELRANDFAWLGLVIPPLTYLGLVLWFRRINSSYTTPLFSAAQFYTVVGLLVSAPTTLEFFGGHYSLNKSILLPIILVQAIAVIFYSTSAWTSQARRYTHIAAWLSILPVTIAWRTYGFAFTYLQFVIPWLLWATVMIAIGFALDKNKVRYSHGPYLAGYLLSGFALAVSVTDRITNIYALAITIVLALISYIAVHYGRHHSYEDFIFKYWFKTDETTKQIASTFFLFFAAYAIPVLLTQILAHIKYPLEMRGLWLAIAAPLYIAVGLFVSKSKSKSIATVPTWALYSAGYALTAIGAMVTFENEQLATYVLILNAVVYGVSAYIFQQTFWLYLTTVLTPVIALLVLHQTQRFTNTWVAWIFIALAYVYLAIGQLFDRARKSLTDIHPFAAPFYAPGFLLSAIAIATASSDKMLAIQIYLSGVILYALSAWIFSEAILIYPATWLAAVPYYLLITLTSLETRWYGLAWLPLIIAYIAIGRIFFHKEKLAPIGKGMLVQWLTHPAIPFYLLAYALSISMISLSYLNPLALTLAFGLAAILYFTSAYLFKKPAWIYAGLFVAHMAVLAYFTIHPSGGPARYITIPFLAMTWLTSLIGYAFERRTYPVLDAETETRTYRFSILEHLFGHAWARPFFTFAIIEMLIWQSLALTGYDTTIIVAGGYALLFALFSIFWMEGALVYGAVGFGMLAVGAALMQAKVQFADAVAVYGGIGFGLYLLGRILDALSARVKTLSVWLTPLTQASVGLTALGVLINLPQIMNHWTATALTLAFAGALYITIAYRGRLFGLGYLGMALLQVAWVILLFMNDVAQPQFYAIPGGLYFMGIAYLELRRDRKKYAAGVEILGLGLLLVTSFIQSLNGKGGLPYFVLLLVEALLLIWWGTLQKRKITFFAGIGASALNIFAQVVVFISVNNISVWYVAFGAGLLIMGLAIYIERSREQLRTRVRELSETLETWE